MRTSSKQCVAFWTLVGIGVLILYGLFAHVAHAEPEIAGDWHPTAAGLASDTATWLLGALVALKIVELALARISPLTKNTWDDAAYEKLHAVNELATEILDHVKPPQNPPPGTLPAIVSGTIETKGGAS
jgi:hypothetical protein